MKLVKKFRLFLSGLIAELKEVKYVSLRLVLVNAAQIVMFILFVTFFVVIIDSILKLVRELIMFF
ncbi:hypothetical protein D6810_02875 [Candidatus Dojkabacteria bacterium]|uniref:Preprotein translocase subunit SecE n=1 Tax=Candidatus Dojkabacteria bacterium TaxID=2099670 RepID=A0A3M0Z1A3_9BACT|nr:MAG: hypothetical protein D6810_02875 [Candidatus Dojkabacteria bacterium]